MGDVVEFPQLMIKNPTTGNVVYRVIKLKNNHDGDTYKVVNNSGHCFESIIYNSKLSRDESLQVINYLSKKWNKIEKPQKHKYPDPYCETIEVSKLQYEEIIEAAEKLAALGIEAYEMYTKERNTHNQLKRMSLWDRIFNWPYKEKSHD